CRQANRHSSSRSVAVALSASPVGGSATRCATWHVPVRRDCFSFCVTVLGSQATPTPVPSPQGGGRPDCRFSVASPLYVRPDPLSRPRCRDVGAVEDLAAAQPGGADRPGELDAVIG